MVRGRFVVSPRPDQLATLSPKDEKVFSAMSQEDAEALRRFMRNWPEEVIQVVQKPGLVAYHGSRDNGLVFDQGRRFYLAANIRFAREYAGSGGSIYRTRIESEALRYELPQIWSSSLFQIARNTRAIDGFVSWSPSEGGTTYLIKKGAERRVVDILAGLRRIASFNADA